ncbi:MAG: GNAT family N-acetyltransferase [Prevotella sp.]|jgi:predicted N-acetyltransferase YhbS|nr:GNAT family N-acetyltransferase [Prevotella sp.]
MKEFSIEKIQNSEIDEVAGILTAAFRTNPAYSIIFKKKSQLDEGLFRLFKASLLIDNNKESLTSVIKEKDTGKITGTFTLVPPEGVKTNLFTYFKIGLFGFISKFGVNSLYRMFKLDACNKKAITDSMGNSPFHYLSMVVIKSEYQGKGIGSFAIKKMLDELPATNTDTKFIGLTTQLPCNVVFYSRLGFEKIDEGYIHFRDDKYYNYNMKFELE